MNAGKSTTRVALEAVRSRLESSPGSEEKSALAELYFRLAVSPDTDVDEGIELLRRALRIDPFHPRNFFHLARLLHSNGDPLEAAVQYREGLKLTPRSHRMYAHLAMCLADLGGDEQELGERILQSVAAGDDPSLNDLGIRVDAALARRFGEDGKPKETPAPSPESAKGKCRWRG